MNTISTNNRNEYVGINKNHIYTTLLVIMVVVNVVIISKIVNNSVPAYIYPVKVEVDEEKENSEITQQDSPTYTLLPGYEEITVSEKDVNSGELILVNYANKFVFDNNPSAVKKTELADVYGRKSKNFSLRDISIQLNLEIIQPMCNMIDDFAAKTGLKDLMIISAYRSLEHQQQTYDEKIATLGQEEGKLTAAYPGHSEHHTGYAFDLNIYSKGESKLFDGTGEYVWFVENSWKYGFIERYKEGKTNLTKIKYEPWHYRYVGACHAEYMYKNSLCLEEYIELLKNYTAGEEHLKFTTYDGTNYEIYYVPINETNTKVPVPVNENCEYTLSGNNVDGIIVTVKNTVVDTQTQDTTQQQTAQQ